MWDRATPTPCRNCGAKIAYEATPRVRTCRKRDCITRLSARNPGPYCLAHTPNLVDAPDPTYRVPYRYAAERFLDGIPDRLTPAERARYARGDW